MRYHIYVSGPPPQCVYAPHIENAEIENRNIIVSDAFDLGESADSSITQHQVCTQEATSKMDGQPTWA